MHIINLNISYCSHVESSSSGQLFTFLSPEEPLMLSLRITDISEKGRDRAVVTV